MKYKFHHIGIACKDIESAIIQYRKFGYSNGEIVWDELQNVSICFLYSDNGPTLELISGKNESSPVFNILKKNGPGPYHICYEVDNIGQAVKSLVSDGFIPLNKQVKAIAIDNMNIVFLYNQIMGLIEIVEVK